MPRVAVSATLLLTAGGRREGEIYVMERVPQHAGSETPLDMLNRAEGFFPFRPKNDGAGGPGGAILLVTKARTVTLTIPRTTASEDPARMSAARTRRLALERMGHDRAAGTPFETARLFERDERAVFRRQHHRRNSPGQSRAGALRAS